MSVYADSAYYPSGAYLDSKAPYNEVSTPEQDFDVTISQTLSKDTIVTTDDYVYEKDSDEGWDSYITDDTNWAEEYHNNDHYTPIQLIELFRQCLEENLKNGLVFKNPGITKHLIEECKGWVEDETEYVH